MSPEAQEELLRLISMVGSSQGPAMAPGAMEAPGLGSPFEAPSAPRGYYPIPEASLPAERSLVEAPLPLEAELALQGGPQGAPEEAILTSIFDNPEIAQAIFASAFDPEALEQSQAARKKDARSAGLVGAGAALLGNIGQPATGFSEAIKAFTGPMHQAREQDRQDDRQTALDYLKAQGSISDNQYREALARHYDKPTARPKLRVIRNQADLLAAIAGGEMEPNVDRIQSFLAAFASDDDRALEIANRTARGAAEIGEEFGKSKEKRSEEARDRGKVLDESTDIRDEDRAEIRFDERALKERAEELMDPLGEAGGALDYGTAMIFARMEAILVDRPQYSGRVQRAMEGIRAGELSAQETLNNLIRQVRLDLSPEARQPNIGPASQGVSW